MNTTNSSSRSTIEKQQNKKKVDGYLKGLLQKINSNHQGSKIRESKQIQQPLININPPIQQQIQSFSNDKQINKENCQKEVKTQEDTLSQRENRFIIENNTNIINEQSQQENGVILIPQDSQIPIEYLKKVQFLIKEYNVLHQSSKLEKDILTLMIQKNKSSNDTVSKFLQNKYNDGSNKEQFERDYPAIQKLVELLEKKIFVLDKAYMRKRENELQYIVITQKQKEEIHLLSNICIELMNMRIFQLHPFQQNATSNQLQQPKDSIISKNDKNNQDKRSYSVDAGLQESSNAASTHLRRKLKIDQSFDKSTSFEKQHFVKDLEQAEGYISNILNSSLSSSSPDKINGPKQNPDKLREQNRSKNNILVIDQTLDELSEIQQDIKHSQNIILAQDINQYDNIKTIDDVIEIFKLCKKKLKLFLDSKCIDSQSINQILTDSFYEFIQEINQSNIKNQEDIINLENVIKSQKEQIEHLQRSAVEQIQTIQQLKELECEQRIQEILLDKDEEIRKYVDLKSKELFKQHNIELEQVQRQFEENKQIEINILKGEQNELVSQLQLKLKQQMEKYQIIESKLQEEISRQKEGQVALIKQQQLIQELQIKNQINENLKQELEKLNQNIQKLENDKQQLIQNLQIEKQNIVEELKNQIKQKCEQIEQLNQNQQIQIDALKQNIQEKEDQINKLIEEKDKQNQVRKNSDLINYQKQLLQKQEEVNKLKQQIQQQKNTINDLESSNAKLKQTLEDSKQNLSKLQIEIKDLKKSEETVQEQLKSLDQQKSQVQKQFDMQQRALVLSEKELILQKKSVQDLKTQISDQESNKLVLLRQIENEQKNSISIQSEMSNLKKSIQELKSQISNSENQKQALQKQLDNDQKLLTELRKYLVEKSNNQIKIENKFTHTLIEQISTFCNIIEEKLNEYTTKLQQFQQIQKESTQQNNFPIDTDQLARKIGQIQSDNLKLKNRIAEFSKQIDLKKESLIIKNQLQEQDDQLLNMKDIKQIFEKQEKIIENEDQLNKKYLKEISEQQYDLSVQLLKLQNEVEVQIIKCHSEVFEKVEKVQKKIFPGGLSDKSQYEILDENLNSILSKFDSDFKVIAKQASGTQWDYGKENRLLQRKILDICEEINKMREGQFSMKMQLRKKEMQDIDTFNQISKNLMNQINKFQTMIEGIQVTSYSPIRSSVVDLYSQNSDLDQGRQSLNPFIKNGNQLSLFGARKSQIFSTKFEKVDEKQNEENDASGILDDDEDFKKFQESLLEDDDQPKVQDKEITSLQNLNSSQYQSPPKKQEQMSALAIAQSLQNENGFPSNISLGKMPSPIRESYNNLDGMRQSVSRIETEEQRNIRFILEEIKKIKQNLEKVVTNLLQYNYDEIQIKNLKQTIEILETELSDYKNSVGYIQGVFDELAQIGDPVYQYSQMNTAFKKCFSDLQQLYQKQLKAQEGTHLDLCQEYFINIKKAIDVVKQIKQLSLFVDDTIKKSIQILVQ